MARPAIETAAQLIMRARYVAEAAGHKLPTALRTSKRTLQRWQAAESRPSDAQLVDFVRLFRPGPLRRRSCLRCRVTSSSMPSYAPPPTRRTRPRAR